MIYPSNGDITQGFHTNHLALDIRAGYQQPVYAPHKGVVTHAGQLGSGTNDAGLALDIDGGIYKSRLGHNDRLFVKVGDHVNEGDLVAYEGFTGYTSPDNVVAGSHVHWVLWYNGERVDGRLHVNKEDDMADLEARKWINGLTKTVEDQGKVIAEQRNWIIGLTGTVEALAKGTSKEQLVAEAVAEIKKRLDA